MKAKLLIGFLLVSIVSVGCTRQEGPLERAGKRVDEIGDNIAEGDPPLKKRSAFEKAGESVDKALSRE
jgi:hypothetical protein